MNFATSSGIVDSLLQPRFISSSGVWESRPIPCRFDSEFSYRFKNRNLVSELIFDCLHRTSTHPWNSDGLFESFRDVRSSSSSARISSILRWSFLMNIAQLRANRSREVCAASRNVISTFRVRNVSWKRNAVKAGVAKIISSTRRYEFWKVLKLTAQQVWDPNRTPDGSVFLFGLQFTEAPAVYHCA